MPQLMPRSFIPDEEEKIDALELTTPKSFIPDELEEEEEQPSPIRKIWNWASAPTTEAPTRFAKSVSERIDPGTSLERTPTEARLKGFLAGVTEASGELVSGLTSPLNIALTATGVGQVIPRISQAARAATKLLSVPVVGEGVKNIYEGVKNRDLEKVAIGLAETAGGATGFHSGASKGTSKVEPPIRQTIKTSSGETIVKGPKNVIDKVYGSVEPPIRQAREIPYKFSDEVPLVAEPPVKTTFNKQLVSEFMNKNPEAKMNEVSEFIKSLETEQPKKPFVNPFEKPKPVEAIETPKSFIPEDIKPVEEPLAARTSEGKIAIGADVKSLGKVLGTSLYKGDIAPIATKELLQNSIDAVRHLGPEGKINVIFDRVENAIQVSDNGKGLTRKELESVFTDLGASGKREDINAAGGFGLAKAAPLLGGKKVEVSSITRDSKGILHEYSFRGTPDELLEGVDIKHRILPEGETGTSVKVYVPEGSDFHGSSKFVENLSKHSPDIQGQIKSGSKWLSGELDPEDLIPTPREGGKSLITLDNPSATTELIEPSSSTRKTRTYMEVNLSNNGMFQGTRTKYFNGEIPNAPESITVNIKPKVPEGHADYPFTANREELRGTVEKLIDDYIDENIIKPGVGKRMDELKRLYTSMPEISIGRGEFPNTFGRKISIYDPKGQITQAEMKELTNNTAFHTLAGNITGTLDEAMKVINNKVWIDRLEKVGIIFDDKLHGIHIPNPGSGKSAILVNPFIAIDKMSPDEASANILHTILHEMAHIEPELRAGHNESFTIRLGDIYGKFGARRSVEAQDNILKSIANPNTGIYHPEIQKILQTYKESRGREATTVDLLSGTGIGSKSPKGGKGTIPPSNKPDGERATVDSAINKLFNSMGKVMENRVQQDIINKTERARRFAAFKGVKDEGMIGASKSLSKLKGEFEKVVPEKLQMKQEEIDTLFTAVKKARITEGEKARGYTALFKLMNGDKLPQRNELKILDDVFGNGFAERIINLHGGLGAINMRIGKVGNTMKAMMSSGDLSMSLRQGVGFAHRPEWRNAVKEQLKYLAQPEYFKAAMDAIEERPKYLLGRESGLFLAKPGGLMNGEEMFMNNYVENIPGVRNVVEASERAYVGGLNKLRSDVFDNLTDLAEKSGVKITNTVENIAKNGTVTKTTVPTKETENIAKYVNLFTGRGSLGKLEPIAGVLNTLFWSPKYRASRLQINPIFNPKFYIDLDPFTRKQAVKSLLAMASASLTFNTLATLSGATIGYNLLSSDFMKSRFKRTDNVMDPNAGMQQPVVAAARMINELNRMGSGKPRKFGERNIGEIGFDYLRTGASPIVGLADELITMRSYQGDKKDASLKTFGMPQYGGFTDKYGNKKYLNTELAKRFTSIFSQDIYEIIESDPSFEEGIGLATGSLLGIGEQRYPERKPSDSHLRRMRLNP